jgi:hypothetical protein
MGLLLLLQLHGRVGVIDDAHQAAICGGCSRVGGLLFRRHRVIRMDDATSRRNQVSRNVETFRRRMEGKDGIDYCQRTTFRRSEWTQTQAPVDEQRSRPQSSNSVQWERIPSDPLSSKLVSAVCQFWRVPNTVATLPSCFRRLVFANESAEIRPTRICTVLDNSNS